MSSGPASSIHGHPHARLDAAQLNAIGADSRSADGTRLRDVNPPAVRARDTACNSEGVTMYKRILVPVDGSETSDKALAAALQLARESGGRVRVLHTFDDLAYLNGYVMGA